MSAASILSFYVGENRYGIEIAQVLHVLPRVLLKSIPDQPAYIAGLLNFRGDLIPVIDFCQLVEQRETKNSLHSRIILVQDTSSKRIVGLLGEKVNDMIDLGQSHSADFKSLPYLDFVSHEELGLIQVLNLEKFFKFLSAGIFKAIKQHN